MNSGQTKRDDFMKIRYITSGSYGTNCYALIDSESGEACCVDCAVFDEDFRNFLKKAGVERLKYILLTHGHFDHICGVKQLREEFGGQVCIHENDALCLADERESLCSVAYGFTQSPIEADILLRDGDRLFLGKSPITVRHTPGHTRGSVCYFTQDSIFSGDTLFRLSMGRTDFPGGSTRQLFSSLKMLGELPENYDIYPGHGALTTLDFEKENNRYLRSKAWQ